MFFKEEKMIFKICDKCIHKIEDNETSICFRGHWEKEPISKTYDHSFDKCEDFEPNWKTYEGLLHCLSLMWDTWVPSVLIYVVEHGYRHKVFAKPDGATKLIDQTQKNYLEVQRILEKTESSPAYKKFIQNDIDKFSPQPKKLKRRKNKPEKIQKLRRRKKK